MEKNITQTKPTPCKDQTTPKLRRAKYPKTSKIRSPDFFFIYIFANVKAWKIVNFFTISGIFGGSVEGKLCVLQFFYIDRNPAGGPH